MIVTPLNEHSVRVALQNDLDASQVGELRPRLKHLLEKGFNTLIVDFTRTRFMCSAGLGLLVEIYNLANREGGTVVVENLNQNIEKLLTDTKLLSVFTSKDPDIGNEKLSVLDAVQKHMSQEVLFLSYLNTITSTILQADVSEDISQLTLEGILRSLHSQHGMLLLVKETANGPALRVAAAEGFEPAICEKVESMAIRAGTLEASCIDYQQAIYLNTRQVPAESESDLLEITGLQEAILSPMNGRIKSLGLIIIGGETDAPAFFPNSTPLVQVFSNVCGLALEKQSLLNDISYKNVRLSATLSELHKTQDTLVEAGKLAAVGALIRGLGHTLNNKLVPIIGYTQMLGMQLQYDRDLTKKIKIIEASANDIRKIIENLRAMVKKDDLKFENCDIREIIDQALFILDYMFHDERIAVERKYTLEDCKVHVDRERIMQAFLALFHRLANTYSSIAVDRRLCIVVEKTSEALEVQIIDNGRVIPPAEIGSILDPFAENDGPFLNDRLNFSIANGILKDHRGHISVLSDMGAGETTAKMVLPLLPQMPAEQY